MAQTDFDVVVLQGNTYQIPKADANPPWGEQLNDYLKALGGAFGTLVGPADIAESASVAINNQNSPTAVLGLSFDSGTVRAAFIDYSIYRTTSTTTEAEAGQMTLLSSFILNRNDFRIQQIRASLFMQTNHRHSSAIKRSTFKRQ